MDRKLPLHLGTAGWGMPKPLADTAGSGSVLGRYARLFNAVEINTTFYRPHMRKTFERWAATVPADFRFSVKMHRSITHKQRLADIRPTQDFLEMVDALGSKLGPVLVQLPPSLPWSPQAAEFLRALRETYTGAVVLEARHASWAARDAINTMRENTISGVAADPPLITDALGPSGYAQPIYYRLHGSPRMYRSAYQDTFLQGLAERIIARLREGRTVWTIFDNTAEGAAPLDALRLRTMVEQLCESVG